MQLWLASADASAYLRRQIGVERLRPLRLVCTPIIERELCDCRPRIYTLTASVLPSVRHMIKQAPKLSDLVYKPEHGLAPWLWISSRFMKQNQSHRFAIAPMMDWTEIL